MRHDRGSFSLEPCGNKYCRQQKCDTPGSSDFAVEVQRPIRTQGLQLNLWTFCISRESYCRDATFRCFHMLGHAPPVPVNRLRSSFHGCLTARSVRCRPDLKSSRQQNRKPHAAIASSNSQGAAQDPREIAQGFVHNWFKYLARKSPQERRELEKYCGATIRLVPDSALVPQTADIQ
eukprot:scaffold90256_cov14-Tisochrysis_lutea.AAC.1